MQVFQCFDHQQAKHGGGEFLPSIWKALTIGRILRRRALTNWS